MTTAILLSVPEKLLDGLPEEDRTAIQARVGQRVTIVDGEDRLYPDYHLVEVMWKDADVINTIWVEPACLAPQD